MVRKIAILLVFCLILAGCGTRDAGGYDLDTARIRADTEHLCTGIGIRVTGTDKEREAADWIMESLRTAGFSEEENLFRTDFNGAKELKSENIVAVCNGGSGPLFSVVAHYDSVATSPGARDNAASVAALLEIARYLGPQNADFPCEIRMVFLGSEENGYYGSKAYVESLTEGEKQRHIGAFNMDISAASDDEGAQLVCNTLGMKTEEGYRGGNFIIPAEGKLTGAIEKAYRELYGRELGGVFHFGESDHVSFHNGQLEAVNVCWRKVADNMPVLPESYHKMEDTPEKLNYETVRASAGCILEAIRILSE